MREMRLNARIPPKMKTRYFITHSCKTLLSNQIYIDYGLSYLIFYKIEHNRVNTVFIHIAWTITYKCDEYLFVFAREVQINGKID